MAHFLAVGYGIFLVLLILLLCFNFILVKYYTDPSESYLLATIVTVLSLTVTLVAALLLPIDIFISSYEEEDSTLTPEALRQSLTFLLAAMGLLAFVLIPFAYFFGEDRLEDDLDEGSSVCDRVVEATKFTGLFMLLCCVLIIIGLVLRPERENWGEGKEWVRSLFDVEHVGEEAIAYMVAILALVGVFCWSIYTAHGLGTLPWYLIKGTKSLEQAKSEIELDISKVRERHREIDRKCQSTKTKPTRKELKELRALKKLETKMLARSERLEEAQKDSSQVITTLLKVLTPFRVVLGGMALVLSVLIAISMLAGLIDRVISSECGLKCGFLTSETALWNPLDSLLVLCSSMFPLDYLLFSLFILYLFLASLYGIIRWGVRLACFTVLYIQLFTIKKKRTIPQALLIASVVLMLLFLGVCMETLTLAPTYATFGSQRTSGSHCSLSSIAQSAPERCIMTTTSRFFNK